MVAAVAIIVATAVAAVTLAACATGTASPRTSGTPSGSGQPGASLAPGSKPAASAAAGPLGLVAKAKTAADKKGDVVNGAGKAVTKPAAADATAIEAKTDGHYLLVTMTLAAAVPANLKSSVNGASYTIAIEVNGSGKADYWLSVENREDGRWVGVVSNWVEESSFSDDEASGDVSFTKTRVHVRVGLDLIGNPSRLRVQGGTQWTSPDLTVIAQDVIPNGTLFVPDPGWLALGS
jgi:hypothetical protein